MSLTAAHARGESLTRATVSRTCVALNRATGALGLRVRSRLARPLPPAALAHTSDFAQRAAPASGGALRAALRSTPVFARLAGPPAAAALRTAAAVHGAGAPLRLPATGGRPRGLRDVALAPPAPPPPPAAGAILFFCRRRRQEKRITVISLRGCIVAFFLLRVYQNHCKTIQSILIYAAAPQTHVPSQKSSARNVARLPHRRARAATSVRAAYLFQPPAACGVSSSRSAPRTPTAALHEDRFPHATQTEPKHAYRHCLSVAAIRFGFRCNFAAIQDETVQFLAAMRLKCAILCKCTIP